MHKQNEIQLFRVKFIVFNYINAEEEKLCGAISLHIAINLEETD